MPKDLLGPFQFMIYTSGNIIIQPLMSGAYRITNNVPIPIYNEHSEPLKLYTASVNSNGDLWGVDFNLRLCNVNITDDTILYHYYGFDNSISKGFPRDGFLVKHDSVFIGSDAGLLIEGLANLSNEKIRTEKLLLRNIRINNENTPPQASYHLDYYENFITISYRGISYQRQPILYAYQMVGVDSNWVETIYPEAKYTHLPSGKLRIQS